MSYTLLRELRALIERQEPFGAANVDKLRAEFIMLMKNVERVKTYAAADKLRTAVTTWREHFDTTVFKLIIPFILDHISAKRGVEQGSLWRPENKHLKADIDGWVKHWDTKLREACYPLISDLSLPLDSPSDSRWTHQLRMSGDYWTSKGIDHKEAVLAGIMEKFEKDSPKWLARVKRHATPAWKALREYLDWLETQSLHGAATKVTVPVRETANLDIEKFKVRLVDYEQDQPLHVTALAKLRLALKHYRQRAAKVFPWLLQNPLPFHLETDCGFDWAGRYERDHVKLCALGVNAPTEKAAHVIAHEMGHHVWSEYLSGEATEFWRSAIASDRGTLDLVALQKVWGEVAPEGHLMDLDTALMERDPTLYLQVQTLTHGHGNFGKSVFFSLEELSALIASGTTQYPVPKNPITAYAAKNPEEAFCEAFGMLVAFGPRALLPMVRQWLGVILPALRVESMNSTSTLVDDLRALMEDSDPETGATPEDEDRWRHETLHYALVDWIQGRTEVDTRRALVAGLKKIFPEGIPSKLRGKGGTVYRLWMDLLRNEFDWGWKRGEVRRLLRVGHKLDSRALFTSYSKSMDAIEHLLRKYKGIKTGWVEKRRVSAEEMLVDVPALVEYMKGKKFDFYGLPSGWRNEEEVLVMLSEKRVPGENVHKVLWDGYLYSPKEAARIEPLDDALVTDLHDTLAEKAGDRDYVAIVLDRRSHKQLLRWWEKTVGIPVLDKIHAHHCTLRFEPTPDHLEMFELGDRATVLVTGWAADDKAQTVRVVPSVRSSNAVAHVTVATAAGVGPYYSQELLARGVRTVHGPALSGVVEHVVRK